MNNLSVVLRDAQVNNYAVGSFNIYNYETIKGVIECVRELKIPAIIAFGEAYLENMSPESVRVLADTLSEGIVTPLALHLDHCKSFKNIIKAIRAGFTSVMYDGSSLDIEENIRQTREIVDIAHSVNVSVEAELGSLAGGKYSNEGGGREIYTDPAQAKRFVEATGVDALAVSIGTVHGMYKGIPKIDMDVLRSIHREVSIPLVLHGGSGTPENIIRECIKNGIRKINVNTEISMHTVAGTAKYISENPGCHLSKLSLVQTELVKEIVRKYILMFNFEPEGS